MKEWVSHLWTRCAESMRQFWTWLSGSAWLLRRWLNPLGEQGSSRPGRPQLALEEAELAALGAQIEEHPWMGGKKGAVNLVRGLKAWVGAGSYDAVKTEMARLFGEEVARRRRRPAPTPFEAPVAEELNQVWSSDLVEVRAWGLPFHVGSMMDVYNQEHLALDATPLAADAAFVTALFDGACATRGGAAPTVCTKTDRGCQYVSRAFEEALQGRTEHVRIPPGCPWYNGESERGNRDLKAVLYALIARSNRPRQGQELAMLRTLCAQARAVLNQDIARPSLGGVTPEDVAQGVREEVKQRNQQFITKQKERRRHVSQQGLRPWQERLAEFLQVARRRTEELLQFLQLLTRDYARMGR